MPFCCNCGAEFVEPSNYCHMCGMSRSGQGEAPESNSVRQSEYTGRIVKCPGCGNTVDALAVSCDVCGLRFSGKTANSTVQDFQNQMMAIEFEEDSGPLSSKFINALKGDAETKIARKKVTLIQSYPVPNTIEEITEFMYLAASSINLKLSKNSVWGSGGPIRDKEVSDAWVGKMEQLYRKAERSFRNEPEFKQIQEIYISKMRELKRDPNIASE